MVMARIGLKPSPIGMPTTCLSMTLPSLKKQASSSFFAISNISRKEICANSLKFSGFPIVAPPRPLRGTVTYKALNWCTFSR